MSHTYLVSRGTEGPFPLEVKLRQLLYEVRVYSVPQALLEKEKGQCEGMNLFTFAENAEQAIAQIRDWLTITYQLRGYRDILIKIMRVKLFKLYNPDHFNLEICKKWAKAGGETLFYGVQESSKAAHEAQCGNKRSFRWIDGRDPEVLFQFLLSLDIPYQGREVFW